MDCDLRLDILQRCERVLTQLQENTQSQHDTVVENTRDKLRKINSKMEDPPKLTVAVYGNTGCGKSSLLNALLGHPSTVPTGGLGMACTSVVIKIEENKQNDNFEADVEFITKEEWEREINLLNKDLKTDNDDDEDEDDFHESQRAMLAAVYGEFEEGHLTDIVKTQTDLTAELGKKMTLSSEDARTLQDQIKKYIEATDDLYQYWPIVRQVKVRVPRSEVCQSGTELIDLPGVRDSNPARDNIAKEYMRNCDVLMIVTGISRAVDCKTVKDVLEDDMFRQVQMDNRKVVLVCTKTDDVNPAEVIRKLKLTQSAKWTEERQKYTEEENQLQLRLDKMRKDVHDTAGNTAVQETEIYRELELVKGKLMQLTREKRSICAVERNKYVKSKIQNRPSPGDGTVSDMAVFCVSSTDYIKLSNLLTSDDDDDKPPVFISADLTQVPEMINFLKSTATEKQVKEAEYLRKEFRTVISELLTHLSISEQGGKAYLKETMTRKLEGMESEIELVVTMVEGNIQELYDQHLNPTIEHATQVAVKRAKTTSDSWAKPVNKRHPKRVGLAFLTYKATLNRYGEFQPHNKKRDKISMNQELADPFLDKISRQWQEIFCGTKWEELINRRIKEPAREAITNCSIEILQSIQAQGFDVSDLSNNLTQLKTDTTDKLDRLDRILTIVQRSQRQITASIPSAMQGEMTYIYELCQSKQGKGAFQEIKTTMDVSIQQRKDTMFGNVKKSVMELLDDLKKDVIEEVYDILKEICEDHRRHIEPLWQEQYGAKLVRNVHECMDQLRRLKNEIDEADRSLFVGTSRKRKSEGQNPQGVEQPKVPRQVCNMHLDLRER